MSRLHFTYHWGVHSWDNDSQKLVLIPTGRVPLYLSSVPFLRVVVIPGVVGEGFSGAVAELRWDVGGGSPGPSSGVIRIPPQTLGRWLICSFLLLGAFFSRVL